MPWMSILLLAIGALLFAGLAIRTQAAEGKSPVAAKRMTRVSNEQVERMIVQLETHPAPEAKRGAKDGPMVVDPPITEYICPVCGETTDYPLEEGQRQTPLNQLEDLRRAEQEAQVAAEKLEAAVYLDELPFCRHCEPELSGIPHAALITRLPNGRQKRIDDFTVRDLWLLRDFFRGKDVVVGAQGDEQPLKAQLPRLRELLMVLPE